MGQNFSFRRPRFSIHWIHSHGEEEEQQRQPQQQQQQQQQQPQLQQETQKQKQCENYNNNNAPLSNSFKLKYDSKIVTLKSESSETKNHTKNLEKLQREISSHNANGRTPIAFSNNPNSKICSSRNSSDHGPSRELYFVCTPHRVPNNNAISDTGETLSLTKIRREKQRSQARIKGKYPSGNSKLTSYELNATNIVKKSTDREESKSLKCSSYSEPSLVAISEGYTQRHRHRYRDRYQRGHEKQKLDDIELLSKSCLSSPGNVPFVTSISSKLYQIRTAGADCQDEVLLPKGMVVKAIFKHKNWLYVETPNAKQGYIEYANCIPIQILLPSESIEIDVSNDPYKSDQRIMESILDISKLNLVKKTSAQSRTFITNGVTELSSASASVSQNPMALNLLRKQQQLQQQHQYHQTQNFHETLISINMDYHSESIYLKKGEIVTLSNCAETKDGRQWFYVKARDGREGYIPAEVAGHGFL